MGLFPWDDAFFNISGRSVKLNQLYADYLKMRGALLTEGDLLKTRLRTAQHMALHVRAIAISSLVAEMSAPDYHQFLKDTSVAKAPAVRQSNVVQVFSGLAELEFFGHFGKALWGFMKLGGKPLIRTVKPFVKPLTDTIATRIESIFSKTGVAAAEDLAISESGEALITGVTESAEAFALGSEEAAEAIGVAARAATLAAAAEATESTLSTIRGILVDTGPGIVIALGIDMLIGGIEGYSEKKEIDEATAKLDAALADLSGFTDDLNKRVAEAERYITDTMEDFQALMAKLETVAPPNFTYDYPVALDQETVDQWVEAINAASKQYIFLGRIRADFHNTLLNHAKKYPGKAYTQEEFDTWCKLEIGDRPDDPGDPDGVDEATATSMLNFVKAHNSEMQPPFQLVTT